MFPSSRSFATGSSATPQGVAGAERASPGAGRPTVAATLAGVENLARLEAQVKARWGDVVEVRAERPTRDHPRPAVWPSAHHPGELGVFIPGGRRLLAPNLDTAHAAFAAAGYDAFRLSEGAHIRVGGTMAPESREKLQRDHGISVTPLALRGREVAYLFEHAQRENATVLLCARSVQPHGAFPKPTGLEIAFAAPRGSTPDSHPLDFAASLATGRVTFDPRTQMHGVGGDHEITNVSLAPIPIKATTAAEFVGGQPGFQQFGLALVNPHAQHVTLADVIQALTDTIGEPARLVCHLGRDDAARKAHTRDNARLYEPLPPTS